MSNEVKVEQITEEAMKTSGLGDAVVAMFVMNAMANGDSEEVAKQKAEITFRKFKRDVDEFLRDLVGQANKNNSGV